MRSHLPEQISISLTKYTVARNSSVALMFGVQHMEASSTGTTAEICPNHCSMVVTGALTGSATQTTQMSSLKRCPVH